MKCFPHGQFKVLRKKKKRQQAKSASSAPWFCSAHHERRSGPRRCPAGLLPPNAGGQHRCLPSLSPLCQALQGWKSFTWLYLHPASRIWERPRPTCSTEILEKSQSWNMWVLLVENRAGLATGSPLGFRGRICAFDAVLRSSSSSADGNRQITSN